MKSLFKKQKESDNTRAAYAVKESAYVFSSDSLQSQSYEFIEIAHIGPYYGV